MTMAEAGASQPHVISSGSITDITERTWRVVLEQVLAALHGSLLAAPPMVQPLPPVARSLRLRTIWGETNTGALPNARLRPAPLLLSMQSRNKPTIDRSPGPSFVQPG